MLIFKRFIRFIGIKINLALTDRNKKGQFVKGNTPWNQGIKQEKKHGKRTNKEN